MKCTVLIVDDSTILRAAIHKVVRLAGIEGEHIHEAGNGRDALKILQSVWIDLVLLDLNMPVMNGEEFVKRVRSMPELAGVSVVVVSTEANKDKLQRLRDLGVVDALHKPFEPEDLRRLIDRILGVKSGVKK